VSFLGQSLVSLDIRRRFGVNVLLIKRKGGEGERIVDELPSADFVFQQGDVMLVLGSEHDLERFERNG
jgi:trk system potassium uptake protein TrkA